jgi:hypothetical protein
MCIDLSAMLIFFVILPAYAIGVSLAGFAINGDETGSLWGCGMGCGGLILLAVVSAGIRSVLAL